MRQYCKALKKEDLLNYGFDITLNGDTYIIKRTWHKTNSKTVMTYESKICSHTQKHPYGKNKTYEYFGFSVNGSQVSLSLSRLLYAWFKGDIPEGYTVDHINDDSLDNRLENLQLLTIKENIRKRGVGRNQFSKDYTDEELLRMRQLKSDIKFHKQLLKKALKEGDSYYIALSKDLVNRSEEALAKIKNKENK